MGSSNKKNDRRPNQEVKVASVKVICPKCHKTAGISEKMIPAGGASARCPNCGEKIRINRPEPNRITEPGPAPSKRKSVPAAPGTDHKNITTPSRPSSIKPSQRTKDPETSAQPPHPESRGKDIEWENDLALVTVETEIGHGYEWKIAGFVFLILASVMLIFSLSNVAAPPEQKPAINQYERGIGEAYGGRDIQKVVGRMRNKIKRKNFRDYEEKQGSAEAAIVTRILKNCQIDCSKVNRVRLAPLNTRDGFMASAFCIDQKSYQITYYWTSNNSTVDGKTCP